MERTLFETEKFIGLVEPNPCLWDTSHAEYCDREKKHECWMTISREMCDDFDEMTADRQYEYRKDIQKKWKGLRNSFARELAKRKKKKRGDRTTWKTYVFFEQLSFLMRSSNNETSSNFTDEYQEAEESMLQEEYEDEEYTRKQVHKKKKIATKVDDSFPTAELLEANIEQRHLMDNLWDDDADRYFLLSLLPDFKRVPIDRKLDLKLAMMQSIKSALLPNQPVEN